MNVVNMNGRPFAANRRTIGIDPGTASRLCEVDPTKLLGHLGSVLPVGQADFQVKFVLDRAGWLRECVAILQMEADRLDANDG